MKCFNTYWTTNSEGTIQLNIDTRGRDRGSQNGLATQVVHETNDVYS
jgi:hypothetical protein